jgi:hypothetical protein
VTEQATLHYEQPAPAAVPARHAAVALLCADSGPGRLATLRLRTGVSAGEAAGALGETLAELGGSDGPGASQNISVILGEGAAGLAAGLAGSVGGGLAAEVIAAPAGQPCTGAWWELAGRLPGWSEAGRRVLLADYEPALGYLCASVIEVEAAGAPSAPDNMAAPDQAAVPGGRRGP